MKICKGCELPKKRSEFTPDKGAKDGLTSKCKKCRRKQAATYRRGRRAEERSYGKKYREAHLEEQRKYQREYYARTSGARYQERLKEEQQARELFMQGKTKKPCNQCGVPKTKDGYGKCSNIRTGRVGTCKVCTSGNRKASSVDRREYEAEYRRTHKEEIRVRSAKRYRENSEYFRNYYQANKGKIKKAQRERYARRKKEAK
jgi:hypothetical protein